MNLALELESIFPKDRIKSSLIDLVAYASDASFYYLRPKVVVLPITESEISQLFIFCCEHNISMTFRAAGTSLSGQAITDGILVDLSRHWRSISVVDAGRSVKVQPGVIGAHINATLKKYQKKIGPDPASINSAMMGGIISNNSSGMCCGVKHNAYHTVKHIKFILPNGKKYSTEIAADYQRFESECAHIYQNVILLRNHILESEEASNLIRKKYLTKNTVGYSMNAFIDYEHPLDIIAHLLVGAEGTLGFIAEAVMHTVPDFPCKATSLLFFQDIATACGAVLSLQASGAEAIELMDRAALRSIETKEGMPVIIAQLPQSAAALLVEYQDYDFDAIEAKINQFESFIDEFALLDKPVFTTNPKEQEKLWKVRKGMFPSVGAVRASGTSVILEDVAFPLNYLGAAIADLQELFEAYHYTNAIIFGHAKDGNIHFVVTQAFETDAEIQRYDAFLNDVVNLVLKKYNGALKAEHGTGRNMAPFVEAEWGGLLYQVMQKLKDLLDPHNILNPGVIINNDEKAHIKNLKQLPLVEEEVDRCMECGFCEHKCPSRDITLTPRKRIVVRRELLNLKRAGDKQNYKQLLHEYQYNGMDTCAVDGLCAEACPVDINTGDLIKRLRRENHSSIANNIALFTARNFKLTVSLTRSALKAGQLVNRYFGQGTMKRITSATRKVISSFPLWSNQLSVAPIIPKVKNKPDASQSIVYFPTCISRVMGDGAGQRNIMDVFLSVSAKAGINVVIPAGIKSLCCGQIYSSKGFSNAKEYTMNNAIEALWTTTNEGTHPVVLDISSCTQTLLTCYNALSDANKLKYRRLQILDSVDYLNDLVLPRLTIINKRNTVTLHPVCSLQKMNGANDKFLKIAQQLSGYVEIPFHTGCCGMAGDRGFLFPELTDSATKLEAADVKEHTCDGYYSSSKTCEIALSQATGKNYESIMYLVDECS
ncbi:FAD-binding and (Fe-S)-binding domain-containing protein [Mucilaginibacter terrae]|uniref:D-lactate dehydrogenase (cytochrome) n=1 Tax=Mucilaginibacter terrae TaxID=1955052 RepID=A0ABU3GTC7_9SPHI|nr:FAD-binding and (Fe-S)-binding domain-containing protein [Mucilaginibacter terrae]MDT3402217.1 D-lactate dehydrogenase [Mucilaginibacter terrae]